MSTQPTMFAGRASSFVFFDEYLIDPKDGYQTARSKHLPLRAAHFDSAERRAIDNASAGYAWGDFVQYVMEMYTQGEQGTFEAVPLDMNLLVDLVHEEMLFRAEGGGNEAA